MLLFYNSQPWEKKSRDLHFDVAMICYDVVEVYQLVRIFIFNKLSNIIDTPNID